MKALGAAITDLSESGQALARGLLIVGGFAAYAHQAVR